MLNSAEKSHMDNIVIHFGRYWLCLCEIFRTPTSLQSETGYFFQARIIKKLPYRKRTARTFKCSITSINEES